LLDCQFGVVAALAGKCASAPPSKVNQPSADCRERPAMPAPGSSTSANVSGTSDSRISNDPNLQISLPTTAFEFQIKTQYQIYEGASEDIDVPREEHHALAMFERSDGRLVQAHGLSAEHEDQDAEQSCDEVKLPHGCESRSDSSRRINEKASRRD
jgi:hypothetical protein